MNTLPTPDHLVWTTPSPVSTATIANGHVDVDWMDGKSHRFHPIWQANKDYLEFLAIVSAQTVPDYEKFSKTTQKRGLRAALAEAKAPFDTLENQ